MSIFRSWGVIWNESIPYSGDWCCENCLKFQCGIHGTNMLLAMK